jgi:hypothetical protein
MGIFGRIIEKWLSYNKFVVWWVLSVTHVNSRDFIKKLMLIEEAKKYI